MALDSLERRVEKLETQEKQEEKIVVPAEWVEIFKKRYGLTDDQIVVGTPSRPRLSLAKILNAARQERLERQKNTGMEAENGSNGEPERHDP